MNIRTTGLAAALAAAWPNAFSLPVLAASGEDLVAIKQQLDTLRKDYTTRVQNLEQRLKKAEDDAAAAKRAAIQSKAAAIKAAVEARTASPAGGTASPPAAANAFNPAISAVLNGTYGAFDENPAGARIPGFAVGPETSPGTRGLSLGESEVSLSANIDQALYGNLVLSFGNDDSVGVEEAYVQTMSLPWGVTLKGGRFFSGIGYLNQKHAHDWDFIDAPLPYAAMLDGQYGDDGIEARWIAPTDFFLEFGAELYRGDTYPAANAPDGGKGTQSVFVHFGDDINDSSSWLAGLSWLRTRASGRMTNSDTDSFSGTDNLGIASLVYKWAPNGNQINRNLSVAGEYFFRHESGDFNDVSLSTNQTGWYLQAVYQFMQGWRAGARYDQVHAGSVGAALAGSTLDGRGHTPRRETALLEHDTSEFGRIRLQYSHDASGFEANNEALLQYTVIFGPHGAHRF